MGLQVKSFTVDDLKDLLEDPAFWQSDPLPITKQKAISLIHNPRADRDDLALLVAYGDGKVVGTLGMVSDYFFAGEERIKMGWLTAWWVDPDWREKGAALRLLVPGLGAHEGKVGAAHIAKHAKMVLDLTGEFVEAANLPGKIWIARYDRSFIDEYRALPVWPGKMLDLLGRMFNLFAKAWMRSWRWLVPLPKGITATRLRDIDPETAAFIESHNKRNLTRRGRNELEWAIRFPWVLDGRAGDEAAGRYHFPSSADRFAFIPYRVIGAGGSTVAFFLASIHNDRMSLPFFVCEEAHRKAAIRAVLQAFADLNAAELFVYDAGLNQEIARTGFPFWLRLRYEKPIYVTRGLGGIPFDLYTFQDGDSDRIFT